MTATCTIQPGSTFGKLSVIKEVKSFTQPSGQTQRGFLCKCECGRAKIVRLSHLRHGRVLSCGCLIRTREGESQTKIFRVWKAMIERCGDPNNIGAKNYLERGITVCEEWSDFSEFKNWATSNGYKKGLTIDRQDNEKGYSPDNCRFVTQSINNCNRRNTFKVHYQGEEISFTLLLKKKRKMEHYVAIRSRIKRGWNVEEAIDQPIREGNYSK
jgi:hypothetical protein